MRPSVPGFGNQDLREDAAVTAALHAASERYTVPAAAMLALQQRTRRAVEARRLAGVRAARPGRIRLAAAAAVALAAIAFTAVLGPSVSLPGGPASARAEVIQGTLTASSATDVTIATAAGTVTLKLDRSATVVDAAGNGLAIAGVVQGRSIRIEGERRKDGFVVRQVTVEDEVKGRVAAVAADHIVLDTPRGPVRVDLAVSTRGQVPPAGAYVEVEVSRGAQGNLVAKEVEVEDAGGTTEDRRGGDSKDGRDRRDDRDREQEDD